MVKQKKKSKINSDSIVARKNVKNEKTNPFEIQTNKEKFKILGRITKTSKGNPGKARTKAIDKRKETLAREFLTQHKSNVFRDKRIGIGEENEDDVFTARFAAEKSAQYHSKKKSLFNLNDEEVLTHKGQTIEEIEHFENLNTSEDESEDEVGKLNADFTEIAHFGGDENEKERLDRRSAIADLIAESKQKKVEKMKEKEEIEELTNVLDEKWKSLIPVIGKLHATDIEKPKVDDFDKMLKEMIFEPRGEPSDRLLSPEEIAKKEREKLEKLEKERLERMKGESAENNFKHKSADDLDEEYFIQPKPIKSSEVLAYDLDGNLPNHENGNNNDGNPSEDSDSEESNDEKLFSDEENNNSDNEDDEETEESDESDEMEENDKTNDFNIFKESITNNEEINKEEVEVKQKVNKDEMNGHEISNEIPYTFKVPKNYDNFLDLLKLYGKANEVIVMDRLIKSNHPRQSQEGMNNMSIILTYLLQYIDDLFSDVDKNEIENNFKILDKISPLIFNISTLIPEKSTNIFTEIIKEKHKNYEKREKQFPGIEVLVFFKLISLIFPTSDYTHKVVTPTFIFFSHILTKINIKTKSDIARGLFLVSLCLEYSQISKRFLPAALNFLMGIFYLAIKKGKVSILKILPPFSSKETNNMLLALRNEITGKNFLKKEIKPLTSKDLVINDMDDNFKIRSLNLTINLTKEFFENLSSKIGVQYLAENFLNYIDRIDIEIYPNSLKNNMKNLIEYLNQIREIPFTYLVTEKRKPKMLRQIEPKFDKVYDKRYSNATGSINDQQEKMKLLHKIKREKKGALREIRRDNEFLAKIQIRKQLQSDKERREKVKRIYAEASVQQGELNALSRSKKKK